VTAIDGVGVADVKTLVQISRAAAGTLEAKIHARRMKQ
jgi:hypothetical protein